MAQALNHRGAEDKIGITTRARMVSVGADEKNKVEKQQQKMSRPKQGSISIKIPIYNLNKILKTTIN